MAPDPYRIVTAFFRGRSEHAICITVAFSPSAPKGVAWIPRSLLHAADDAQVDDWERQVQVTFRMRAWKAEELHLAGPDDDGHEDE